MKVTDLTNTEYAPYYNTYLEHIEDVDLIEYLEISLHAFIRFVRDIPLEKLDYVYAPGKWTIRDIIQHLIDTERVFAYRALRFARNDKTPLTSIDENGFADSVDTSKRSLNSLLTELATVREATLSLFRTFDNDDLIKRGFSANYETSVRALGFIIIAHQIHHMKVYQERYL